MKNNYLARLAATLTALVLVLSLASCSTGENEDADVAPDTAQTTVVAPEASELLPASEQESAATDDKQSEKNASSEKQSEESASTAKKASASATTRQKAAASAKKTAASTERATTAGTPTRSLIARTIDTSVSAEMDIINNAVSFGRDTIKFLTGRDPGIDVQIRSRTNASGGVQLFLYVKNKTGRSIRLNGYSSFKIKDLLGEEVLSTDISLNDPLILKDQEDTWLSVTLPENWMASDELRQITLEAGIFSSTIALDYDLL